MYLFWSSVNLCEIHLAEIFHTFKIRFKMKYNRGSEMQTALAISQIVCLRLLSIIFLSFDTFALPATVTGRSYFDASLTYSVPIRHLFLQLRIFS